MRLLTVVGARPQFVKAFAVSRVLREDHDLSAFDFHTASLPTSGRRGPYCSERSLFFVSCVSSNLSTLFR